MVQPTVVNLEQGMPTVANARIRLEQAFRTARANRTAVLKIIHGYGSTGKGGAIKRDTLLYLESKKKSGGLREYVPGERFSPFDPAARAILSLCPDLAKDRDYARDNPGITIVLL